MSHLAEIDFTHFRCSETKWQAPKRLPKGSLELLAYVRKHTGTHMVQIETQYLTNTDTLSMYYFADVTLNDGKSKTCTRVSEEALLQRNKKSY